MPSLPSSAPAPANTLVRLSLKPGQSHSIRPKTTGPLQINRKGILNATFLPPEQWRLTALKPGLVLLKAADEQWLVEVEALAKASLSAAPLPAWLCRIEGLSCNPDLTLVQGEAVQYPPYLQAKKWCLSHPPCSFYASLSSAARSEWQTNLSLALGKHYEVTIQPSGHTVILSPCGVGQTVPAKHSLTLIDQLSQGLVTDKLASVACQQDFLPTSFLVHAKVILLASQEAKDLGFDTQGSWLFDLSKATPTGHLLSKLKSWLDHKKAHIIGEPSLKLSGGIAARAQTGGEFPVLVPSATSERAVEKQWKSYGMELKVTVQAQKESLVLIQYHFALSQPGETRLSTNSLQSEITIPTNQAVLAGVIELQSEDRKNQGIELLQKVPLISPLFRHSTRQHANSKVLLWLYVATDDAKNQWAPPWQAGTQPSLSLKPNPTKFTKK